jgi:hypothetical protein
VGQRWTRLRKNVTFFLFFVPCPWTFLLWTWQPSEIQLENITITFGRRINLKYSKMGLSQQSLGRPQLYCTLLPSPAPFAFDAPYTEPVSVNFLRRPGIDSQPVGPVRLVRQPYLTYRPARLHRLAESIPWNRFLGS